MPNRAHRRPNMWRENCWKNLKNQSIKCIRSIGQVIKFHGFCYSIFSTPIYGEIKSVRSVLIKCKTITPAQSNRSGTLNYLLSMLPFFRVCTNEERPFSCLNVKHTSNRKSRAISSLTKCSLISISKMVGGTEPLAFDGRKKNKTK